MQTPPLAFLAPDIVEAIIHGRQPPELKAEYRHKPLSIDWRQQRQTRDGESYRVKLTLGEVSQGRLVQLISRKDPLTL
jgi:hypothetical protein